MTDAITPELELAMSIAKIIGTHLFTIKIYERNCDREGVEKLKEQNQKLESQMDKLIAMHYNNFAERQKRLGVEFEAAIFNDIDGLYETDEALNSGNRSDDA